MDAFLGYPVFVRTFDVGGRRWDILGPANFEHLIDDPRVVQRFEQDEFMPYWAEFWPASLALAEAVAEWPPAASAGEPPLTLEFGCGLGLISLIAASRGYRVIASDYDEDALGFVRENARRNGVGSLEARFVDWRKRYPDLRPQRIIAAEVTYERRNLAPIAAFIKEHLATEGFALLVDRNRQVADAFPDVAADAGLVVEQSPTTVQTPQGEAVNARFFKLRQR